MANSSAVSILDSNSSAKTVSTIDAMFSVAGTPSSVNILTVQRSTNTFTIDSLSSGTVIVTSISGGTITSLTSGTVFVSSGTIGVVGSISSGTIASLSSGTVAIGNAGTVAAVKGSLTAPSTTDASLVVGVSPNSLDFGSGTGGSHTLRVIMDLSQLSSLYTSAQTMSAGFQLVSIPTDATVTTGGRTLTQATSVTISPSTTTAYASGQLVANSTANASITPIQFTTLGRITGGSGVIVGAALQKTSTATSSAAFRIHYFNTAPTFGSGAADHVAITTGVQGSSKGYLGYVDITAMVGFSDGAWGTGAPDNTRGSIPYVCAGGSQTIYGIIEARGAYTPVSTSEVFIAYTMALQD